MQIAEMPKLNTVDWKSVRTRLIEERRRLFDFFLEEPTNIRHAGEIMRLDDLILDYGKRVELPDVGKAA